MNGTKRGQTPRGDDTFEGQALRVATKGRELAGRALSVLKEGGRRAPGVIFTQFLEFRYANLRKAGFSKKQACDTILEQVKDELARIVRG